MFSPAAQAVANWLESLGMGRLTQGFLTAGYDNLRERALCPCLYPSPVLSAF
jgi:hypothetical protein